MWGLEKYLWNSHGGGEGKLGGGSGSKHNWALKGREDLATAGTGEIKTKAWRQHSADCTWGRGKLFCEKEEWVNKIGDKESKIKFDH